jgi:hypothetical protein
LAANLEEKFANPSVLEVVPEGARRRVNLAECAQVLELVDDRLINQC